MTAEELAAAEVCAGCGENAPDFVPEDYLDAARWQLGENGRNRKEMKAIRSGEPMGD